MRHDILISMHGCLTTAIWVVSRRGLQVKLIRKWIKIASGSDLLGLEESESDFSDTGTV